MVKKNTERKVDATWNGTKITIDRQTEKKNQKVLVMFSNRIHMIIYSRITNGLPLCHSLSSTVSAERAYIVLPESFMTQIAYILQHSTPVKLNTAQTSATNTRMENSRISKAFCKYFEYYYYTPRI